MPCPPACWDADSAGCHPSRLPAAGAWRQGDDRPDTRRRILEPDGAGAAAQQLAGDRQAEPAAAGVPVARLVQPREPVEDALARRTPVCRARRRRRSARHPPRWPSRRGTPASSRGAPRCRRGCPRRAAGPAATPAPGAVPVLLGRVLARTGTRAAAYRSATSARRSAASTSSTRRGPPSSPARASTRRSSTSPDSRCTSGSRSGGKAARPRRRRAATSSWVRMLASGLRSSWAASATKERCLVWAAASRSSIPLRVVARAATSSPVGGTGRRSSSGVPWPIRSAPWRRASTGRRAEPITRQAITPRAARKSGKKTSRRVRSTRRLVSRSAVGTAATTATRSADGPASTAATSSAPDRPVRWPGTVMDPPAASRFSSAGLTRGVSRSAVAEPPTTRCWLSITCTTCAPETGTGSGSRPASTRVATSLALALRLGLHGAVEGGHHGGVEEQPAQQQRDGDPRQPHDHEPRAQAQPRPEGPHGAIR